MDVSVIIPAYNRGSKIRTTVDSVLRQTLPMSMCEIIIIDDGSTDGTFEFLHHVYGGHPQVRLIQQRNRGVAEARNHGLQEARGKYIAFLDHDDHWLPTKLEAQLAAFQQHPHAGVVYCLWREVDESGHALPDEEQTTRQAWWRPASGNVFNWLFARNPIISMSVPLIRREMLEKVGGFDPATVPSDDHDLWLRLARCCEFACVPHELVLYTHHLSQQTRTAARAPGMAAHALRRVFRKHWMHLVFRPHMIWYLAGFRVFLKSAPLYQEAKQALSQKDRRRAWSLIRRLIIVQPLALLTPQWVVLILRLITGAANRF